MMFHGHDFTSKCSVTMFAEKFNLWADFMNLFLGFEKEEEAINEVKVIGAMILPFIRILVVSGAYCFTLYR